MAKQALISPNEHEELAAQLQALQAQIAAL